ncbi:hypothetical protein PHYBLDRAFT_159000 [Phycomyces blakesleeanus NRRL 1555(-)]|uniref:Uncharacterized protein n=1 Tax=Phycomyces blakesleeanus (strain ATCC 8743b / DSM 1359 / FGSC 10004 / NBRC 33097 / NRRL 1555) TaxID=763407 RepID=A0A162U1X8_PHYB8|nr:hypothetical protein PHYBLDRAFT_159000 [Phycomyces blakesleeanus NRRL 1555(-)]OAD72822.1 hypothetical protein PHYBLDRAFT_159000 [Phycomyces blakesleeanus NRRL 1555(-)]|eukprot:XP_018290862.1 hypothetical protein PHYBLDRAFT_159000 [Phycomyces blakesleeanus NRRL 1555(-)]
MHNYTEGENIFEVDCLNTIGPPDNELDYASDDSQSREKDFSEDSSVQNESDSKILLSGVLSTRNIPDSFSTEDEDEDEYTQQIIHDSEESMSDSYSPIEYMDDPVGDQPSFKKRYIEDQNTRPKRRRVIPNSQEDESEYSVMLSVTNAMNDTSLYEGMQDILGVRERRHRKVIPNSQPDIEPGDTEDQGLYESRIRGAFLKKFIDDDQSI